MTEINSEQEKISKDINKKRCLISGIGGSIGCHFVAHIFHNTDWEIVGIDSFRHKGWTDRVNAVLEDYPGVEHVGWRERLSIVVHDLSAPISPILRKQIGDINYVINLASLSDVEASIQNPVPFVKNNVDLVLNMLEYAREIKPEVFVQISTDEVYGASASKYGDLRKEWDAIVPSNPYAASKAAQEAVAISYWRTYGIPLIIVNSMNNFGEMQQSSKYPAMIQKWIAENKKIIIHGREGQIGSRSYIHSRNFADAVLFLIKNCKPHLHTPNSADRPDRYNVAGDKQLDNLELAQIISKLMGNEKLDYELVDSHTQRPGHDPHYGLDNTKLYSLGWKSPLGFEESMKNTIEWQKEHPNWMKN